MNQRKIPKDKVLLAYDMWVNGSTRKEILDTVLITRGQYESLLFCFMNGSVKTTKNDKALVVSLFKKPSRKTPILSHKTAPYFEKEEDYGLPSYEWEELSKREKSLLLN